MYNLCTLTVVKCLTSSALVIYKIQLLLKYVLYRFDVFVQLEHNGMQLVIIFEKTNDNIVVYEEGTDILRLQRIVKWIQVVKKCTSEALILGSLGPSKFTFM